MATENPTRIDNSKSVIPTLSISPIFFTEKELTEDPLKRQMLDELVNDFNYAMENVGFVQISVPNFPRDMCIQLDQAQNKYFALPKWEKNKIKLSPEYPYGYECNEILSNSFGETDEDVGHTKVSGKNDEYKTRQNDFKETFQICLSRKFISNARIPENPEKFGEILHHYYNYMTAISFKLMELFALALQLPRNFFEDKIDNHQSSLRLLNYPPIEHVTSNTIVHGGAVKIRASEHSDYGIFTILRQDDIGGLQIRRSQKSKRSSVWEDVEPLKEHFIVNIGDLMMRWTNDKWKSTVHRVVAKQETFEKSRQSIAFFFNANCDAVIETIKSCCGEKENKYDSVVAGEYLRWKSESAMTLV